MTHYRVFVTESGIFRDSSKYEFIAEFGNKKNAINYVQYMGGKERFKGKDIIIKAVSNESFNVEDGCVAGVVNAMGEELHIEEFEFN